MKPFSQFYKSYDTKSKSKTVEATPDQLKQWSVTDFMVRAFLVPDKTYKAVYPRLVALPVPLDSRKSLADWYVAKEVRILK